MPRRKPGRSWTHLLRPWKRSRPERRGIGRQIANPGQPAQGVRHRGNGLIPRERRPQACVLTPPSSDQPRWGAALQRRRRERRTQHNARHGVVRGPLPCANQPARGTAPVPIRRTGTRPAAALSVRPVGVDGRKWATGIFHRSSRLKRVERLRAVDAGRRELASAARLCPAPTAACRQVPLLSMAMTTPFEVYWRSYSKGSSRPLGAMRS